MVARPGEARRTARTQATPVCRFLNHAAMAEIGYCASSRSRVTSVIDST